MTAEPIRSRMLPIANVLPGWRISNSYEGTWRLTGSAGTVRTNTNSRSPSRSLPGRKNLNALFTMLSTDQASTTPKQDASPQIGTEDFSDVEHVSSGARSFQRACRKAFSPLFVFVASLSLAVSPPQSTSGILADADPGSPQKTRPSHSLSEHRKNPLECWSCKLIKPPPQPPAKPKLTSVRSECHNFRLVPIPHRFATNNSTRHPWYAKNLAPHSKCSVLENCHETTAHY